MSYDTSQKSAYSKQSMPLNQKNKKVSKINMTG